MNTITGIKFWSKRFSEHCALMLTLLKDNQIRIEPELNQSLKKLEKEWNDISSNPKLKFVDDYPSILDDTLKVKNQVHDKFNKANIECRPDLITHMIEELQYFEKPSLKLLDAIIWWCQEHSENLTFTNCQLKVMIAQDSDSDVLPPTIQKMINQNEVLIKEFKDIGSAANSYFSMKSTDQLYNELIPVKIKHLDGITNALNDLSGGKFNQFIGPKNRKLLATMWPHESQEADYAFHELNSLKNPLKNA